MTNGMTPELTPEQADIEFRRTAREAKMMEELTLISSDEAHDQLQAIGTFLWEIRNELELAREYGWGG